MIKVTIHDENNFIDSIINDSKTTSPACFSHGQFIWSELNTHKIEGWTGGASSTRNTLTMSYIISIESASYCITHTACSEYGDGYSDSYGQQRKLLEELKARKVSIEDQITRGTASILHRRMTVRHGRISLPENRAGTVFVSVEKQIHHTYDNGQWENQ